MTPYDENNVARNAHTSKSGPAKQSDSATSPSPAQGRSDASKRQTATKTDTWTVAEFPMIQTNNLNKRADTSFSLPKQNLARASATVAPRDQRLEREHTKSSLGDGGGEAEIFHDIDLNSEDEREYDMAYDEDLEGEPEVLDTETVRKEQKEEAMEKRRRMFPPEFSLETDVKRRD